SPVRFDGVAVGESARREYEEEWIKRERERLERKAERDRERGQRSGNVDDTPSQESASPVPAGTPIAPPRFVSEAYFMDFKFEPGNYYLAGREQLEGKDVLRIEYYPRHLFSDDDKNKDKDDKQDKDNANAKDAKDQKDQKSPEKKPRNDKEQAKEDKFEQDID